MSIVLKTIADATKVKFGDSYFIDPFPDPSDELQDITPEMFELSEAIQVAVEHHLANPRKFTEKELRKMREPEVVQIALNLGIEASVKDRKADTIQRILDTQTDLGKVPR
jgi:hypothetical protein